MNSSLWRLINIVAYMAARGYEIVDDIGNDQCYMFIGREHRTLGIEYDEIQTLLRAGVIEVEGGCNERGHETIVYRLTDNALKRVKYELLEEKKRRAENRSSA